jgi:hypothetical protein
MGDVAAKNREFVPQDHDLKLLELARAQPQRRHHKHTPKQQVQQRRDQKAASLRPSPERANLRLRLSSNALSNHLMDLRTRQVHLHVARAEPERPRRSSTASRRTPATK